jgi:hypothetical protein
MAGRPKGSKNKTASPKEVEVTNLPSVDENVIYIDDLPMVKLTVEAEIAEKKLNPSAVTEGEAGINFINGEPHLVIDNQYVPHAEAEIILQTRKVVREWLKLENLKKGIKE